MTYVILDRATLPKDPVIVTESWDWDNADWNRAQFMLEYNTDGTIRSLVQEIAACPSVEDAANVLTAQIQNTLRTCVPHKQVRIRRKVAWMSKPLLRLIQRKNCAYSAWRRNPSPCLRAEYNKLHKKVRAAVKEAKRTWAQECFDGIRSTGDFWKVVRRLTSLRPQLPSTLVNEDGSCVVSDADKASLIARTLAQNFNGRDCLPVALPNPIDVEPDWLCDEDFVFAELSLLRNTVAVGPDEIPARFLKPLAASLSPVVSALINRTLHEGICPLVWKTARLAPIPKIPGSIDPADYRPISILPVLSKVYERWLLSNLRPFLHTDSFQFAYSQGSSTEDAIAALQHQISSGFEECVRAKKTTLVAVVSLDIKRAFDQVPYNALLLCCQRRDMPPCLIRSLKAYLTGRRQFVCVGRSCSNYCPVQSGVPQGSVPGGILFNAFVDVLFRLQLSNGAKIIMYADDLILCKTLLGSESELELQVDLDAIAAAFDDLFLSLSQPKCKLLLCSLANSRLKLTHHPQLNGVDLVCVDQLKYLGVVLNRKLAFDINTQQLASRAKRVIGVLHAMVGKYVGKDHCRKIYTAKVLPILTYALPVTSPRFKKDWAVLEKVQRFCCRLQTQDFTSSYPRLLQKTNYLQLSRISFIRGLLLLFKYVTGMRLLPSVDFSPGLSPARASQRHVFRHSHTLSVPNQGIHSRVGQSVPLYRLMHLWNSLYTAPGFDERLFNELRLF